MDVEDLTEDELAVIREKLAGADAPAASTSAKEVEVDGLRVTLYPEKTKSWRTFEIVSKLSDEIDYETVLCMFELLEYVSDVDREKIIEHCGGADAPAEKIVEVTSRLVIECSPKK